MLNVCLVGHGMMGVWHSEALQKTADKTTAKLHTVVGRPPAPEDQAPTVGRKPPSTAQFAARFGYEKWTTDLGEALADPEVDVVIIAGPSETHADMALAAIEAGKHTLVEIPIAMNLAPITRASTSTTRSSSPTGTATALTSGGRPCRAATASSPSPPSRRTPS
jgi:2-hydroxy-4-carboxymuconate semialdehyde hemiacetal dehydrogenase